MTETEQEEMLSRIRFLEIWNDFDGEQFRANEDALSELLFKCRNEKGCPAEKVVGWLVKTDQSLCSEKDRVSCEAFRLFYLSRLPVAVVSRKLGVTSRVIWNYLAAARRRMMIYIWGVDGFWRYTPRSISDEEWVQMTDREQGYHLYWSGYKLVEIAQMLDVPLKLVHSWKAGWLTGKTSRWYRANRNAGAK